MNGQLPESFNGHVNNVTVIENNTQEEITQPAAEVSRARVRAAKQRTARTAHEPLCALTRSVSIDASCSNMGRGPPTGRSVMKLTLAAIQPKAAR